MESISDALFVEKDLAGALTPFGSSVKVEIQAGISDPIDNLLAQRSVFLSQNNQANSAVPEYYAEASIRQRKLQDPLEVAALISQTIGRLDALWEIFKSQMGSPDAELSVTLGGLVTAEAILSPPLKLAA